MSEDYPHRQRQSASVPNLPFTQTIFNQCLIYIEDKLLSLPGGNPLSTYGLPSPNRNDDEPTTPREILAEYAYDREEMQQIVIEREPTLTPDQTYAYFCFLMHQAEQEKPISSICSLQKSERREKLHLLSPLQE